MENLPSDNRSTLKRLDWKDNPTIQRVIKNCAAMGMSMENIGKILGVSGQTIDFNTRKHPELEEALLAGRSLSTQHMVSKMYRTALGGEEIQEVTVTDGKDGRETKTVTKVSQPNPLLMMFWMTNRDPENWKHIRQILADKEGTKWTGDEPEQDKIAGLYQRISVANTAEAGRKRGISEEIARHSGEGRVSEADFCGDVYSEAADSVQDDVLDVPTEEGTV